MIQRILIICIGNICRSPMAEIMALQKFNKTAINITSAGLGALVNEPAHPISCELMMQRGLDLSLHRARQLNTEMVFDADLIWTMTQDQVQQVQAQFPSAKGRVFRIGHWLDIDVADPFRRPLAIFEQAMVLIEQSIEEWCKKLQH